MSDKGAICNRTGKPLSLIETLRYEPENGLIRKDMHLERLQNAAQHFDINFSASTIITALDFSLDKPHRIRIELTSDGQFNVTKTPFQMQSNATEWKISFAEEIIQSDNPLIRYKTSHRGLYQKARAEFETDKIDEVILCNEKGQICEGTITNIFIEVGPSKLLTPALTCGLLPGIYRQHLLNTGIANEAILTPKDLFEAQKIYVGNSLREMIRAKIV